jgi:hypothetical protein
MGVTWYSITPPPFQSAVITREKSPPCIRTIYFPQDSIFDNTKLPYHQCYYKEASYATFVGKEASEMPF